MTNFYTFKNIEIEYFEEAIDLVSAKEGVDGDRVGMVGISKGELREEFNEWDSRGRKEDKLGTTPGLQPGGGEKSN